MNWFKIWLFKINNEYLILKHQFFKVDYFTKQYLLQTAIWELECIPEKLFFSMAENHL